MAVVISRFCYAFNCSKDIKYYYCKADENNYSYEEMLSLINNGLSKEDFIQIPRNESSISRKFLELNNVHRYRMKKISQYSDNEIESVCHWYCEENGLIKQWSEYLEQELSNIAIKWCNENYISYTMKNY